ncbi:hypothetical protein HanRHA438_Chr03g0119091 [Helianthus annuus]|nr:hypothetical protein HanRHA438_Chr03g0119091 [Helianthus annuus]
MDACLVFAPSVILEFLLLLDRPLKDNPPTPDIVTKRAFSVTKLHSPPH